MRVAGIFHRFQIFFVSGAVRGKTTYKDKFFGDIFRFCQCFDKIDGKFVVNLFKFMFIAGFDNAGSMNYIVEISAVFQGFFYGIFI